jgi:hypothetical protein
MTNNKTNTFQKIKKQDSNTTNLRELPTNMNPTFCKDMIKEHQVCCGPMNLESPYIGEDLVFISEKGHVYRKMKITDGIEKRVVWTILHNNNGACGWYRVDSPALFRYRCNFIGCSGIQMSDGSYADYVPENPKVYNINSLRYCLVTPMPQDEIQKHWSGYHTLQVDNEGKEELYLYICAKKYGGDMLLGYNYPMVQHSASSADWTPSSEIKDQNILNAWMNSRDLSSLPFYDPDHGEQLPVFFKNSSEKNVLSKKETVEDSFEGVPPPPPQANDWRGLFDWGGNTLPPMSWDTEPLTPWGEDDDCNLSEKCIPDTVQEKVVEQDVEQEVEHRFDPTADDWFTKEEFVDYYGDDTMWDMCSSQKNSRRWMIDCYIERSYEFLSSKQINHLLDKIVETFV